MPALLLSAFLAAGAQASHPVLPQPAVWAGVAVIVIGFIFLAAAIVGPIFRALSPQEMPVTHSHAEPPAHH